MKRTILILIAVLGAATVASATDTAAIWEKSCLKCHGADGKGDTKMGKKLDVKDLTDAKYQASFTDEQAFKAIKEGIKDGDKTKMKAAEGLSDDDIKALVAKCRASSSNPFCGGATRRRTKQTLEATYEENITNRGALSAVAACSARAADSKEIYEKDCVKCHGADGKGETKMGKKLGAKDYSDAKVQADLTDDAAFKAIKEGLKKEDRP